MPPLTEAKIEELCARIRILCGERLSPENEADLRHLAPRTPRRHPATREAGEVFPEHKGGQPLSNAIQKRSSLSFPVLCVGTVPKFGDHGSFAIVNSDPRARRSIRR